jgi:titin
VSEGFGVSGNGDTIEGFSITDFSNGILTSGTTITTLSVQGNFIGIEPDGSTLALNGNGLVNNSSGAITIGGTSPANSNVISGNATQVTMGAKDTLQGNIIGLNAAGNTAVVNRLTGGLPGDGVLAGPGAVIGGTTNGAGNVISGNGSGIRLVGNVGTGTALIEGNLIGTDVTGKKALGNEEGITATGNNAVIGGTTAAARNIISGNFNLGIDMGGGQGNVVEGNYIGTDITGEVALPNGGQNGSTPDTGAGILLSAAFTTNTTNNIIGGTTSAARNIISGNAFSGIRIAGQTSRRISNTENNLIEGNLIGLDATGTKALGNGTNGVFIGTIQGFGGQILNNSVKNNVIAHNGRSGILIGSAATDSTVHTPISQNSIFANGGLGIDLAPQGVINTNSTPPGPNDYTHAPVIKQATTTQINGTAPAGSTVEVFLASNESNDLGHGEGQTFLGSVSATNGTWSLSLTTGQVAHGQFVTATTTTGGTTMETSEFAANVQVS